jgi:hypothetical protein
MVSEPPTGEPDREICQSGSEGRAKLIFVPTPILAREPVGLWSRFGPVGPGEPSPGFSLGGVTINATSPAGAEEIVI